VSGFVGIVHFDGAPPDSHVIGDLTRYLSFRGPDAQEVWSNGEASLGHALLQIPARDPLQKQPFQLEHRLWIVADARIDARGELIAALNGSSPTAHPVSLSMPDAELILHAYDAWGDACVEHLLGDFSFAIWDARKKKLFCARDHFGVKQLYYANVNSCLIVSNTLNCIRMHPAVSSRLNDLAIANFLLFDAIQDPAATSFADIQRLPAAHSLTCERGELSPRRYWTLSVTTPLEFSRKAEYVKRFHELLDVAVADRVRGESAGILMSGGLDSSTIAASAKRVFVRAGESSGLRAYTDVFDSLVPYEERHYAQLVAAALKIPIEFFVCDNRQLFEFADQPGERSPEPVNASWPDGTTNHLRRIAVNSRVALTGYGGDPTLCGRLAVHFRHLIDTKQYGRAVADVVRYLTVEGRLSRLYLRTRWNILVAPEKQSPEYPPWLNPDFEKALGLRERWESLNHVVASTPAVRPEAQEAMSDSLWANLFDGYDAGVTGVPVEVCHPFFDLRLVNFLLALPRLPWCSDKQLLREAARGMLPDAVRLRRKSPMAADPLLALLSKPDAAWVDHFEPDPELGRYVIRQHIPAVQGTTDSWNASVHLRPLSLNFWLRGRD
jgi:asparagine synthase (glutamine-hydrolysing)